MGSRTLIVGILILCLWFAIAEANPPMRDDVSFLTLKPSESIQKAIDKAPEGALISLEEGVWKENLVIKKSITLRGKGAGKSVIEGVAKQGLEKVYIMLVASPQKNKTIRVVLQNLTLRVSPGNHDISGIKLMGAHGLSLRGVAFPISFPGSSLWILPRLSSKDAAFPIASGAYFFGSLPRLS